MIKIESELHGKDKIAAQATTFAQFTYNLVRGLGSRGVDTQGGWEEKSGMLITHLGDFQDTERRIIRKIVLDSGAASLLDAGCGPGAESGSYAQEAGLSHLQYFGIDGNSSLLSVAQKNLEQSGLAGGLVRGDLRRLPFNDSSFDIVLLKHVLEHQPQGYEDLVSQAIALATRGVIINFFQALLPGSIPDIPVVHRSGVPYNWYNRRKFEHFLRENTKVLDFTSVQCRGLRGAVSDIYYVELQ